MSTFTLECITSTPQRRAPSVILHGPPKVGKTTTATGLSRPIVLRTEDGLGNLQVPTFPDVARTYSDVLEGMGAVITGDHDRAFFILDSVSSLEPIIWAEVCRRNSWASIETPGFGKGYVEADRYWATLLEGLDAMLERGIGVVLIGHSTPVTHTDPGTNEELQRHELALHKRARGMLTKWADVLGFCYHKVLVREVDAGFNKKKTVGIATDARAIGLVDRPQFEAGNRLGMPATLELSSDALSGALTAAYAGAAPAAAARPITTE